MYMKFSNYTQTNKKKINRNDTKTKLAKENRSPKGVILLGLLVHYF